MDEIIGYVNVAEDKTCSCIKANYYKMGGANFLRKTQDGLRATAVITISNEQDAENTNRQNNDDDM